MGSPPYSSVWALIHGLCTLSTLFELQIEREDAKGRPVTMTMNDSQMPSLHVVGHRSRHLLNPVAHRYVVLSYAFVLSSPSTVWC
jgi:hypothetical protein